MTDLALPIPKPKKGQPCNGCGFCCVTSPCELAVQFLDCSTGPCVALERDQGRTWCGLVRQPAKYFLGTEAPAAVTGALSAHLAWMLALGAGCDAQGPDESE